MADEKALDRMPRLLGLVPYLLRNPGADLAETAARFDVDPETLEKDLELLTLTGLPGGMPDDLIDIDWESDGIYLSNADLVSLPARLSPEEGAALVLALDYLESVAGDEEEVVRRVRAKIQAAAGASDAVAVSAPRLPEDMAPAIRRALREGSGLAIEYYVPSRDEVTRRVIVPRALRLVGGLRIDAWCHTAQGERTFLVENLRSAVPAPEAPPAPAGTSPRQDTPDAHDSPGETVHVTFDPAGAWIAEEIPGAVLETDVDGSGAVRATFTAYSQEWVTGLMLRHGAHVRAVEPDSWVRGALSTVEDTLALHS